MVGDNVDVLLNVTLTKEIIEKKKQVLFEPFFKCFCDLGN